MSFDSEHTPEHERTESAGGDGGGMDLLRESLVRIVAYMRAERVPASKAVDALLPTLVTDEETRAQVTRVGWIFLANDVEHQARSQRHTQQERDNGTAPRTASVSYARVYRSVLEESMQAGDGTYKPLFDFTAADWKALAETCAAHAHAATKRAAVAESTAALLEREHKANVRCLPAKLRKQVEAEAEVAWRGNGAAEAA